MVIRNNTAIGREKLMYADNDDEDGGDNNISHGPLVQVSLKRILSI
jgi:hypothetical protein